MYLSTCVLEYLCTTIVWCEHKECTPVGALHKSVLRNEAPAEVGDGFPGRTRTPWSLLHVRVVSNDGQIHREKQVPKYTITNHLQSHRNSNGIVIQLVSNLNRYIMCCTYYYYVHTVQQNHRRRHL